MELSSRKVSRVVFAYLWSILFWMGLAFLAAGEDKVRFRERGLHTSYWTALLVEGGFLLSAALLTPPIFAIVHRYPITKPIRFGRVAGYILGIALYIIACVSLHWILSPPWNVTAILLATAPLPTLRVWELQEAAQCHFAPAPWRPRTALWLTS